MGALTNLYVATSSGSDITGDGSSGNPYATVQAGVFTLGSRDATNGNFIHLSGADILSATLNFATWGAHGITSQLVIGNWIGGPDGQGELDGNNGNFPIFNAGSPSVTFLGLKIGNTGTGYVLVMGDNSSVRGCEIHTSTGNAGILKSGGERLSIIGNYFHDLTFLTDLNPTNGMHIYGNYAVLSVSGSVGFRIQGQGGSIVRNIVVVTHTGVESGIRNDGYGHQIVSNSILSTVACTGYGIGINSEYGAGAVMNNLVEGFSGAGGRGFDDGGRSDSQSVLNNAAYNNTTNYKHTDIWVAEEDNESLSVSPFDKSGANTFANRFVYFNPVDTGNVWGGGYPVGSNLDKGAVQHAAVAARYMKQSHYRFRRNDGLLQAP